MRVAAVLLAAMLAATPALAVQPDEVLPDAELEARARAISRDLRCPVCQGENIDESNAPISRDLRLYVRERLVAGDDDDAVIDAVGMEAHGSPVAGVAHQAVGLLPSPLGRKAMETAGVDRLAALYTAIDAVRRGGTISISGVYGGMKDPLPLMTMFDKQLQLRMGQCNVRRWTEELLPLVDNPADPLGVLDLTTHTAPLDQAPAMYEKFQKKEDGCIKVVLKP